MKYDVQWQPDAEEQLAALWLAATDRNAVTQAAAEIDRSLEVDAHLQGESRDGDDRILFVTPLGILFRIFPADARVMVTRVGWSGRPG